MTAQHTPGPYRYRREERLIVTDGEGMLDKLHIAKLCSQAEDTDANGYLLAAAPLMLEALKALTALPPSALLTVLKEAQRDVDEIVDQARSAIRAATGEDA